MASTKGEAQSLIEKIEAVIKQPQAILDLQDDAIRRKLREAGRKLSLAMEAPGDTVHRVSNTVCSILLIHSLQKPGAG